ncbi:hypothetical protein GGI00_003278 [Coemansia sp. RSA 2681]|nr:hypothetical protein GGI00_003278 [Coemansia sp. RSA 2681]
MSGFGNLSRSRQHRTADSSAPSVAANPNPFGAFSGGLRGWSGGGGSADARGGGKSRDERPRSLVLGPGGRTPSHSSRADSSAATPEPVNTRNMFDLLKNEEEDESRAESAAKPPAAEPKDSAAASASASASKPTMDTPTMKRKVKGIITEYMSLKDDTEFTECFKELEEVNYQKAVFEITNYLMDRRPAETEQVAKGLRVLRSTGVLSEDTAVAGLAEYSELLEDMAIDAPNAYKFFGMLMAGMQVPLSRAAESLGELVAASSPAMSVVFAYLNHLVAVDGEDKIRDAVAESNFDVTQFLPTDKRSEADVQSTLQSQGLLELFPQFA